MASLHTFAQEAILQGRIERVTDDDALQLYVMGAVDTKRVELEDDGSFSIGVDLLERSRAILFWKGRGDDDWTCTLWLYPDSISNVKLSTHRTKKQLVKEACFSGAGASLSTYTNLYYQTFERQTLLDEQHLTEFPDFKSCQKYIEQILQPLGEALLDLTSEDFSDEEESDFSGGDADEAEDDDVDDDADVDEDDAVDYLEQKRRELDYRQAEAEFTYALLAEHRGQKMANDAAFMERLKEMDPNDAEQADAIAFMTSWRIAAFPDRYKPLRDEAAQLRCLEMFTKDEDVRNEVADRIMQRFFLRVQMGEVDPADPAYSNLYDIFQRVSTDTTYDQFILTQKNIMEHPELYTEDDPVE